MIGIEVRVLADETAVAAAAAGLCAAWLRRCPNAVLGLAIGSTPVPTYSEFWRPFLKDGASRFWPLVPTRPRHGP